MHFAQLIKIVDNNKSRIIIKFLERESHNNSAVFVSEDMQQEYPKIGYWSKAHEEEMNSEETREVIGRFR